MFIDVDEGLVAVETLVLEYLETMTGVMSISDDEWVDFFDSFRALNYPIIIEDFINFQTEYRSLFIGDQMFFIKRKDIPGWKVQHSQKHELIPMPNEIQDLTFKAKEAVGLDIGALDIVEHDNGYTVLEINDAPDINPKFLGINENTWDIVAKLLIETIK